MGVVRELRRICRDVREEHGLDFIDVGVHVQHGHGRDKRTLEDFEEAKRQPDHIDSIVAGYAKAAGLPVSAIVKRVYDRLRLLEKEDT